jgi:hypothetical protein
VDGIGEAARYELTGVGNGEDGERPDEESLSARGDEAERAETSIRARGKVT